MPITDTPIIPTTFLEAVNELLRCIRVAPINTLTQTDSSTDAAGAALQLGMAARELQARGWEWNTERELEILPDLSGEILLPANTMKVVSARCSRSRLVQRGFKLYDLRLHTYAIGETVEVDLVLSLTYEELTQTVKAYVTALAARRFALPRLPTNATFQYTEEYLRRCMAAVEQEEADMVGQSLKQTSPHFARMGRR